MLTELYTFIICSLYSALLSPRADLEPFLRQNGANSVRLARYLTNHLTFFSETLHIYLLPLYMCHAFRQVLENYNSKYQT